MEQEEFVHSGLLIIYLKDNNMYVLIKLIQKDMI